MKSPFGRVEAPVGPHYQDKLAALILVEKPEIVVETGCETGFGAEYILRALDSNMAGKLYSIDPVLHGQYPADKLIHPRFKLIQDYSFKVLGDLFLEVGPFDLFVHDSDHSVGCQAYEYEMAWYLVRPGGIIASDDPFWGIPAHLAWTKFLERHEITQHTIIGNAQWIRKPKDAIEPIKQPQWVLSKHALAHSIATAECHRVGAPPYFIP